MKSFALPCAGLVLALARMAGAQPCAPPSDLHPSDAAHPTAADYNQLGVSFADREQYACAANAFATSLQADPHQRDGAHVVFMFGSALYLSGDGKEAIPALQQAEQLGYRSQDLHTLLASALDAAHARADAEDEWRQALEFDPELTMALDALSGDLLADGKYREVIAALDVPRLVAQRSEQQVLNLSAAYAHTGRAEAALSILQDGWNTYPDSAPIATALAAALQEQGQPKEADAVRQIMQSRSSK